MLQVTKAVIVDGESVWLDMVYAGKKKADDDKEVHAGAVKCVGEHEQKRRGTRFWHLL